LWARVSETRASGGEEDDTNLNVTNLSPDTEGAYSVEVIG